MDKKTAGFLVMWYENGSTGRDMHWYSKTAANAEGKIEALIKGEDIPRGSIRVFRVTQLEFKMSVGVAIEG